MKRGTKSRKQFLPDGTNGREARDAKNRTRQTSMTNLPDLDRICSGGHLLTLSLKGTAAKKLMMSSPLSTNGCIRCIELGNPAFVSTPQYIKST